jgi:hypothetical protein
MRGVRLLPLFCLLLAAGCRIGDPVSFFNEDKAIEQAVAMLKERVRSISGDLVIESVPERGVRLEVTFAKEA